LPKFLAISFYFIGITYYFLCPTNFVDELSTNK